MRRARPAGPDGPVVSREQGDAVIVIGADSHKRTHTVVAVDQVRRRCGGRVAACGAVPPAAVDAQQAVVAHQPGDPFAADMDVQAQPELGMHAWRAIGAPAAGMDLADLFAEIGVLQRPLRRRARRPGVVAGACHTQHAT